MPKLSECQQLSGMSGQGIGSIDRILSYAADGDIDLHIINQDWPLKPTGSENPTAATQQPSDGMLTLLRSDLRKAIGCDAIDVSGCRTVDGHEYEYAEPHQLFFGRIYISNTAIKLLEKMKSSPLEPRERQELNLVASIGALALLISKLDDEKFEDAGKPNIKAIATAVSELVDTPEERKSGLSIRSLQGRISAGLEALAKK